MPINHTKLLSGRAPVVPYDELTSTRYEFLALGEAEPNLGTSGQGNILTIGPDNTRVWTNTINANVSTQTIYVDNIVSYTAGGNIAIVPSGNGILTLANINGGATGIQLGTNTTGAFISNAVVLTSNISVTNGIADLNYVLGKLVPPPPPNFPGNTTLTITTANVPARMCSGFTQPNNTTTGNKAVAAGTLVNAIRSTTYTTTNITNVGPGDIGNLTVYLNSVNSGNVTFNTEATPSGNGTHGNLIITNNYDYHYANANILATFWYVFSAQANGIVPSGWNEVYMSDSSTGNTNTAVWWYDSANIDAPTFSSTT